MTHWIRSHWLPCALMVIGLGLAVMLRLALIDFKSGDYYAYTKVWYNTLRVEGFSAFSRGFSNYSLPYLYLIYLVIRFLPGMPAVVAVKLPSLLADFVMAWFSFRIINLQYQRILIPLLGGIVMLMTPTVVLNSAFWGQADALYGVACVACLYFLIRNLDGRAMAIFGVACAIKAQSFVVLPALIVLAIKGVIRWRSFIWVPIVYGLALVPAILAGRSPIDLLLIYPSQAGQYDQLTMHAPSALAWLPDAGRFYSYLLPASLALAGATMVSYVWVFGRSTVKLDPTTVVKLFLISSILLPFVLPKMHERYFYLADVVSIILAFMAPRFLYVGVSMVLISFLAYQPALLGAEPVRISLLSMGVFSVLIVLGMDFLRQRYPASANSEI